MEPSTQTYECKVHSIEHTGSKRETFDEKLFETILNASMEFSYRLYRDVKHGCHCPENYAIFDALIKEMERSKQTQ